MSSNKSYKSALIFLTTLFFLWGFITVLVDSLVPRLKDVFEMSYAKTVLVQFAFFTAFFVVSVPAGAILSKIGYRKGIVLGLVVMATALSTRKTGAILKRRISPRVFPPLLMVF